MECWTAVVDFTLYTQSPHNLAILHLGQLSGPSAVTAAVVAVNGLIASVDYPPTTQGFSSHYLCSLRRCGLFSIKAI